MSLTLITGPMKSGKSLELIARVAPLSYAGLSVLYVQAAKNVRDMGISSRAGISTNAVSAENLTDIKQDFDVIGIDEINMFGVDDISSITNWLTHGKKVFVSGLDLDYRGIMLPIIKRLMELQPEAIIRKTAVCDVCKRLDARFTQILSEYVPVTQGLPVISPEDGTYEYQARCRECFVRSGGA